MLPIRIKRLFPAPSQIAAVARQVLLEVRYLGANPVAALRHRLRATVLAGPGFLGFAGGVYNPGAVGTEDGGAVLLCKAQKRHWLEARGSHHQDHLVGAPLLMRLGPNLDPIDARVLSMPAQAAGEPKAVEDFRLFRWRDWIGVNYHEIETIRTPERVGYRSSRVALARLSPEEGALDRVGSPDVDFELRTKEKNWVFFEREGQLFALYSLAPYRVLRSTDGGHSFLTCVLADGGPALRDVGGFGTLTSLSTNPIRFDARHDLVLIHQVDPDRMGRHYTQWPLLIDRETLLPVRIGKRPILCGLGARGLLRGVLYASSIVARGPGELVVFHGEGDSYASFTRLRRDRLERGWAELRPRLLRRVDG